MSLELNDLPGNLVTDCCCCGEKDLFVFRHRDHCFDTVRVVKKGFPTCCDNRRICDACESKFVRYKFV